MNKNTCELQSISCPLSGVNLIEAAAGTGKTYNIQNLVVRMVLEAELPITSILVVTYTEAAAAELRDRIRRALKFTFDALSGNAPEQERLRAEALLDRVSGKDEKLVEKLLFRALQQFDDAVITTIHGFCRRALTENAFESGILFNSELETDMSGRIDALCTDFYRRKAYSSGCTRLDMALFDLAGFNETVFGRNFRTLVMQQEVRLAGAGELAPSAEYRQKAVDGLERLPSLYSGDDAGVRAILAQAPECWSGDDWRTLSGAAGRGAAFATGLAEVQEAVDKYGSALRLEALFFVREGLNRMKIRDNVMGFDDLLILTRNGINAPGGSLLTALQRKYKAGIIDEFQDTDPVQYEIFFRMFGDVENPALFMVGDPRQAIYSFRGGDLATYFHADCDRAARDGNKYTLSANYRSAGAMIRAVNRIFAEHESPFASGMISFSSISVPEPEIKTLSLDGVEDSQPLRIVRLPDASYKTCDEWCAGEILSLLRSQWQIPGREKPGVEPGDIAVLVFDRTEADNMRNLLQERKIPAVCAKTGNVFASGEAVELRTFLQAVLNPGRRSMVCNALATSIGGVDMEALAGMLKDENCDEFGEKQRIFSDLNSLWREAPFISVFHRILEVFQVKERYPAMVNGERKLTDILHLGDILQQHSVADSLSPHALLALLERRIDDCGSEAPDEYKQLLETDRKAVRIMTVHHSKGLEFPIVMLPGLFRWFADDLKRSSLYHDSDGVLSVDFANSGENLLQCYHERMQELLRLVYVALTRAKYRCHLYWGKCPAGGGQKYTTALHWLFNMRHEPYCENFLKKMKKNTLPPEDIPAELLCPVSGDMPLSGEYVPPMNLEPEWCFQAAELHNPGNSWRMSSYSSLSPHGDGTDRIFDDDREPDSTADESENSSGIMAIPGGAALGNAWHGIFEQIDFAAGDETIRECAGISLLRYGVMRASDKDKKNLELTCRMVRHVLDVPLRENIRLCNIVRKDRLSEMEFCYSFRHAFSSAAVRDILSEYAAERFGLVQWPEWNHKFSGGCLNGFIDLIFRHEGKYYLLDWKSNRLGGDISNFEEKGLCRAMAGQFYFLQYLFYTVALVKYLQLRLGKFGKEEYDAEFGGIFYIFLRGVSPEHPGRGIFFERPDFELISRLEKEIG